MVQHIIGWGVLVRSANSGRGDSIPSCVIILGNKKPAVHVTEGGGSKRDLKFSDLPTTKSWNRKVQL